MSVLAGVKKWAALLGAIVFCAIVWVQPVSATGPCPNTGSWQVIGGVCFPSNTGLSSTPVATIIMNVLNWLLAVLGFIAVLGFVISGMQYLTSAGEEGLIETAKRNMKYSIIGVVVALSGRVLIMAIDNMLNASTTPF